MTTDQDPYRFFRIEAAELSEELSRGVLALGTGSPLEHVPRLLRAAHTLKGAARVVKHRGLAERAHALEELLGPLRERSDSPSADAVDALLAVVDSIAKLTRDLSPASVPPASANETADAELPAVSTDGTELDDFVAGVAEVGVQLRSVRGSLAVLERIHDLAALIANHIDRALPNDGTVRRGSPLVKARAMAGELEDLAERAERSMTASLDQTERELTEVQGSAEKLRLVRCGALTGALERTAYDAARELGKRVTFTMTGGDARLDAQMLGRVRNALVQIVRNAVAHGIELPDERRRRQKAQKGTVEIRVLRRGSRMAFVCRDDGRGIDLDGIRKAAERTGAVTRGATSDTASLLKLLLKGGISTAPVVTETAGRGIGLDVVRETAALLGGDVTIETKVGLGTVIELTVPIVLSSMEAILVESGGTVAAIPLEAIVAAARLSGTDVVRGDKGESIVRDGRFVPILALEKPLFPRRPAANRAPTFPAIFVRGGSSIAAFAVDRLLSTETIIVRGIPSLAPTDPVVLGAWLGRDGSPQLVLDPDALVAAALVEREIGEERSTQPPLPVLVVDDSLTTRMLERSILESAGFEVELAASAEEALEKSSRRKYGLFLVDVEMPGMSGFEFVARTRAQAVPAILVSSRNSPEDFDRGREVGASAYVVKAEFDQRRLLETIRGLVAV
ncbi:MAG TPA: response regulator [Polyangiaceae bacterium]|jgi:two-component system chemotaxis sensor kinase CheA|nr:response regulator [Polyangiaceae bacterium]